MVQCGIRGLAFAALWFSVVPVMADPLDPFASMSPVAPGESTSVSLDLAGTPVTLDLDRFRVTTHETQFVMGSLDGPDRPINFDVDQVALFRGTIRGEPGTSAFVALYAGRTQGWVSRGDETFILGAAGAVPAAPMSFPAPTFCPVEPPPGWVPDEPPTNESTIIPGRRIIQVAVETDYEFYELFDDTDDALAYVIAVYGANSSIMQRDVAVALDITYVRIWDDPADLFTENDPLGTFRNYWNDNMGFVNRDTAQFFSGQRTFPYGGVAWVSTLCSSFGYSVVGYALGTFEDPEYPSVFNRDVIVTAHELGHNFGTLHNHDYGLDTCQNAIGTATRGTIMSYCGQTRMGGEANLDARFDTVTGGRIREYVGSRAESCLPIDCNGNGVRDAIDIANGDSPDINSNGVCDECEDCNGNGFLDGADIAAGRSEDVDSNGVPDECQADCNGNQVPDRAEIAAGLADVDLDGVPDICEEDCDGDLIADSSEILADMSKDINRDVILDACQDCDNDGTIDLIELNREGFVITATLGPDRDLREFHGLTGVLTGVASGNHYEEGNDLVITPDRRVLVSSGFDNRIVEFDVAGTYIRDLVSAGSGGLDEPAAMLLTGDTFLVTSRGSDSVLEFDLATGAFVRTLVATGSGGLDMPFGLLATPSGTLLVTSHDDRVLEYDASTGVFIRTLVGASSGGLAGARGMALNRDGNLLIAGSLTGMIHEYNTLTGDFIKLWNRNGSGNVLVMEEPWCIRIDHDYRVHVSDSHAHPPESGGPGALHLTASRVYVFDWRNGNYERALIQGHDTGLNHPGGFDFIPGDAADCNRTFFPDNCEIAMGVSADDDDDGTPDECQSCPADLTSTSDPNDPAYGIPDRSVDASDFFFYLDLFVAQSPAADLTGSADLNNPRYGKPDGVIDASDFFHYLDLFVAGCPG